MSGKDTQVRRRTVTAGTYVSLVGWDIVVLLGHVVPINASPRFDFLPLHTGDARQLHGFAEDRLCCRGHIHAHRLAHVD